MIKGNLTKCFHFFRKIPPWKIISGGILVIVIFLAIFFSISAKKILIIDQNYLLNNLPREESFLWLNYFKKLNLKKIELIYKKKQTKFEITGRLVKQDELPLERIINFLKQFDYNLKLFKKRNTLWLVGKREEKLALPENNLTVAKNLKFDKIFLASNLNLEKFFGVDNLETNLSVAERKTILKILSQTKESVVVKKSKEITYPTSFDYFGSISYYNEKDLADFENLFSKIVSLTKPTEKIKTLPDGSKAVELVIQPEKFSFQDEKYLNFILRCQRAPEINWQICYLKDKDKIYFATKSDYLKEKLSNNRTLELINLADNPNFLNQDKLLILKKDLLNYSELAKRIFSDLPEFSYLVIVEVGNKFLLFTF